MPFSPVYVHHFCQLCLNAAVSHGPVHPFHLLVLQKILNLNNPILCYFMIVGKRLRTVFQSVVFHFKWLFGGNLFVGNSQLFLKSFEKLNFRLYF